MFRSNVLFLFALAIGGLAGSSANAVNVTVGCGALVVSVVRTENAPSVINSVAFVNIPGAIWGFAVPAGQSRCIKVTFTGEAACRGPTTVGDFCYIRALDNGIELSPQGPPFNPSSARMRRRTGTPTNGCAESALETTRS